MDLRLPYIKLVIVMGLITWVKDYQKIEEVSPFLRLDAFGEMCHTDKSHSNNPDSVTCSFAIFHHHIFLNQNQ